MQQQRRVYVTRAAVCSGASGRPGLGCVAVLRDVDTGAELARSERLGFSVSASSVLRRARTMAKRRGWVLVVRVGGGVWVEAEAPI